MSMTRNSIDAALTGAVEAEPCLPPSLTRLEADSFIDSLGDEMRATLSAQEAIAAAFVALDIRKYTSTHLYIASSRDCLLFAGKGLPIGIVPGKTTIPLNHPVLDEIVQQGRVYDQSQAGDIFPFQGGIMGFPLERHSPWLGQGVRGAFIVTYNPLSKSVVGEESRVLERTAAFIGDRMLQLAELGVYHQIEKELRVAKRNLEDLQKRNMLTGLYNERTFRMDLDRYLAEVRRGERVHNLILLDIDQMRTKINDIAGYTAGNEYLARVAEYIRSVPAVAHYRVGGDKFGLITEMPSPMKIEPLRSMGRSIKERFISIPAPEKCGLQTVSMGIVTAKSFLAKGDEWYLLANGALSEAKEVGNTGVYYDFDPTGRLKGSWRF